jgi:hypothetical protein
VCECFYDSNGHALSASRSFSLPLSLFNVLKERLFVFLMKTIVKLCCVVTKCGYCIPQGDGAGDIGGDCDGGGVTKVSIPSDTHNPKVQQAERMQQRVCVGVRAVLAQ